MTVQDFISALGGSTKVARDLGIPMTTVATWGQRGKIPEWRLPAVVNLALKSGVSVPVKFTGKAA